MNLTKLIATASLTMAVITMITPIQLSIYASPTTEDDGWTEGDYSGSPEEQEQQAQDDWEHAGRPGDNDNDDDDDNDDKTNDLPRCKLGVVVDCVLNDLGQTCEVGTSEDACQDIYGGVQGSPERDQNGQLINKPNPYCDQPHTGPCHDRKDYNQGGPNDGLYPCNDGTVKEDWRDCEDATKSSKDTSSPSSSNNDNSKPYPYCKSEMGKAPVCGVIKSSNDNVSDRPECVNGVRQECVISAIGLGCKPGYDLSSPSIVGGGHACQDIYAGTYEPESESDNNFNLNNDNNDNSNSDNMPECKRCTTRM
jgi:hypothetical protein